MRQLGRLMTLYAKIDAFLDKAVADADLDQFTRIRIEQAFNDQAYFLLCWGQLEQLIDETCRDAIRRRRAQADWQDRRGWDLYNPEDIRLSGLPFEGRAALVLDRLEGRGRPYALVMKHYEARNRIAHGKLGAARIDLVSVLQEFRLIQSALHRAA